MKNFLFCVAMLLLLTVTSYSAARDIIKTDTDEEKKTFLLSKKRNKKYNNNEINEDYLLKPTGSYGIGFRDTFLINKNICPDAFYKKKINERDFSSNNESYCHEIAIRIYYPTPQLNVYKDKYYAPYLKIRNQWIENHNDVSKQDIEKLNSLENTRTFTSRDVTPSNEKFPIIIFMPGAGDLAPI